MSKQEMLSVLIALGWLVLSVLVKLIESYDTLKRLKHWEFEREEQLI